MRNELLKLISIGLAVIGLSSAECKAQAAGGNGLRLDRLDVQRFEQSYEAWVQNIVHHVLPKSNVSILTEFNYTNNPEIIQNYEERRAVDHLPGLPDVSDSNISHPTDNPIYDLITQQNIKVIFEEQPSEDQIRILKEILAVKLNLDTSHGDQVSFDNLHRGNGYFNKALVSFSKNTKMNLLMILLAAMGVAIVLARKNKKDSKLKAMGEKEVDSLYLKVNPISAILKSDPKFLISMIRNQELDFMVQVMAHAPVSFNQVMLQVFEENEKKALFDAFQAQRLGVSVTQSKYAQLVLAAKIHDELKLQAIQQVDEFNEMSAKINEQRLKMQESLIQLKALYTAQDSNQEFSEEVNNEASI
jgi:hypothetical protein